MLEMLVFAVEPFGTLAPGPAGESVGGWTKLFDSIANNPQAIATITAAFLGFLGGVLIKDYLDRRAYRLRTETDRRTLASALRAELLQLDVECGSRIDAFEELLKELPKKEVLGGPHSFARMALPPRRVWMALLGRIGELEGFDPDTLLLVHSSFDSHDLAVETEKNRAGGEGVSRKALQDRVDQLKRIRQAIAMVGGSLVEQTRDRPSWWRRMSRF